MRIEKWKTFPNEPTPEVKVLDTVMAGCNEVSDVQVRLQVGESIITLVLPIPGEGIYKQPDIPTGLNLVFFGPHYT